MLIGYARVSTFEQDLNLQIDALEKDGCDRIFLDKGESGSKDSRPEWDKCLEHLRKGDTLVIWKLDRAGRSTKHLIELSDKLEKRGIELRSLREQIDTSTAMGRFFFRTMASIAELELDIIRERTMAGLAAAKARGRKGGRKKSITKGQELEAKRLVAAGGLSVTDICEQVGISRASYYRLIPQK
ncbi:MAG: invertase [Leptolyngbya foveolarum]|uniref:Invertase n=1 Tax=Leptolyngbya foveolarum TaxID=47253 RepID=A0A2W4UNU4_9CYAN|nr:MAG: invertase [Leptolyngbya foveolarum]